MGCACSQEALSIESACYDIDKKIGEGGFSVVYLANSKGQKFAIKKISCYSERELKRTQNEIEAHKNFGSHRNVLELMSSKIDGLEDYQAVTYQKDADLQSQTFDTSIAYLVFPFYRRGTVHDDLQRQTDPYSESQVLSLFLDVAEALKQFHSHSTPMVHRDVKTANVLLDEESRGILMDFGSVSVADVDVNDSKQARTIMDEAAENCSMPYRPPELFNLEVPAKLDSRTDIWSLGCLLYALCYKKSPFEEVYERGDSVALAVAGGTVKFPPSEGSSQNQKGYSHDLQKLIVQLINVTLTERPFIEEVITAAKQLKSKVTQQDDNIV